MPTPPCKVAVTQFAYPDAIKSAPLDPPVAPSPMPRSTVEHFLTAASVPILPWRHPKRAAVSTRRHLQL